MKNKLAIKKLRKKNKTSQRLVSGEYFEGPIPPPSLLSNYEQIFPGAAERIVTMAEKQSQHRQQLEAEVVKSDIENERRGMNYSLVITLALVIIGAILILNGKDTAGYFSIFGPSVFHAGNYVYSKMQQRNDLNNKNKEVS